MTASTISIIVNVFNGASYVRECLDSIAKLAGGYRLQLLVIDDASSDETPFVLRNWTKQPLQIIRHASNLGAANAINNAFELVEGEYVARIDYDDRYHPNFLVDSVSALERHPDAAFVCASAVMIGPDGSPRAICGPHDYGELPGCNDRFRSMLVGHFVTAPTILGRTEHWRRAIPIPTGMDFCDWYMNLAMAESAPVVVLDKITADYRVHTLGMHTTNIRSGVGERITMEVLDRFLQRSPRNSELAGAADRIIAGHFAAWGDRYFGANMNADALRCYRRAIEHAPSLLWRGKFLHRMLGLLSGRERYEEFKRSLLSRARPDAHADQEHS